MITLDLIGLAGIRAILPSYQAMLATELPAILQGLALAASALMQDRTVNKFRDINDAPFAPYSDTTMTLMAAKGHPKANKTSVNLFDTGIMTAGVLTSLTSPSSALVYVGTGPARVRAMWHQMGEGRLPKREWFGLTPKEQEFIAQKFEREFTAALRAVV